MSMSDVPSALSVPEQLPLLSRGKHRNPRKGACFMELASYLAGEQWSDHPACTHSLLAVVAREVNDHTSDAARPRLAVLIPSVVGLVGEDPLLDARLALLCAEKALPVVAAERQRVMAVGVLACERVLDGRPAVEPVRAAPPRPRHVAYNAQWAYRFSNRRRTAATDFRRDIAPRIISGAVQGIARACIPDPDAMLYELLVEAIELCGATLPRADDPPARPEPGKWADACALTGLASGA